MLFIKGSQAFLRSYCIFSKYFFYFKNMYLKISRMYLTMFCTISGLHIVRMFQREHPGLSFQIFCLGQKEVKFWHLTAHTTSHMCRQQVWDKVKLHMLRNLQSSQMLFSDQELSHCPFSVLGLRKTTWDPFPAANYSSTVPHAQVLNTPSAVLHILTLHPITAISSGFISTKETNVSDNNSDTVTVCYKV